MLVWINDYTQTSLTGISHSRVQLAILSYVIAIADQLGRR